MIECIFTLDYEIYGNGQGDLGKQVYEPATKLIELFNHFDARMVVFVETAELEMIEAAKSDPAINDVIAQVREMYHQGYEIALHLHPQWYNAKYREGKWELDYSEYNLCILPRLRIAEIVERSIAYLRKILDAPDYQSTSFRAGNWLFQPTSVAAEVLADHGIKIDTSVFKGGVQRSHRLDYRSAFKNGYYWKFSTDVTVADPAGRMFEVPIYTAMVPFWKMVTAKRTGFRKGGGGGPPVSFGTKFNTFLDRTRLFYPLKFDFCRMTLKELIIMVEKAIREDVRNPTYKPLVAIGHTKDLVDFKTIELFIEYLNKRRIKVTTFDKVNNSHSFTLPY